VLKLESTKEFEELFNAWSNEILSEVRFWRDIAEKARSIDFGKLIRSIRLSRKRRPDLLPALKGEVCQR
jgi:hypothetical protein